MNYPTLVVYLLLLSVALVPGRGLAQADNGQPLTIVDPYIELHTGPATAYPIFHVIDRGETIQVLLRKTNWYRIRAENGIEGWVDRNQLQRTLQPDGAAVELKEYGEEDFRRRDWELGLTTGELADAPILSLYGGYALTENLSAELTLGHSVGNVSSSTLLKLNLLMQPFPDWEYSPFFTLGLGRIKVKPSVTLVEPLDQENDYAQIGFGFKTFLTRNFVFRAEVNEYVIFSASNDKDENEDVSEWKLGFAIFF